MNNKSVRWSTITVYEFGVGIGGSAVPKRGGPAIGLAKTPECVWRTTVDAVQGAPLGEVAAERHHNEQLSGCKAVEPSKSSASVSTNSTSSSNPPKRYRQRRVRWLKPLERVSMLEKAGYSEKKIYRMLMESSQIAMSRRLCLRIPIESSSGGSSPSPPQRVQ